MNPPTVIVYITKDFKIHTRNNITVPFRRSHYYIVQPEVAEVIFDMKLGFRSYFRTRSQSSNADWITEGSVYPFFCQEHKEPIKNKDKTINYPGSRL